MTQDKSQNQFIRYAAKAQEADCNLHTLFAGGRARPSVWCQGRARKEAEYGACLQELGRAGAEAGRQRD